MMKQQREHDNKERGYSCICFAHKGYKRVTDLIGEEEAMKELRPCFFPYWEQHDRPWLELSRL
jgi:hypothetical protein